MAYTLAEFVKLNPDYKKRYDPSTKTAYLSNTKTGKEISFGLGRGSEYGIGGASGGSHTISDPGRLIAALGGSSQPAQTAQTAQTQETAYQSPYSEQIGRTLAALQNRGSFSYDPSSDEGLQAAQESAMDAVSRAAARRGMLYSDSNKSQMGKASLALIPQFEQTAFNRYQQQGQSLQDQLNMLMGLENQVYGQYRDTVGDEKFLRQLALSEAGLTGAYQGMPTLQSRLADREQAWRERQFAASPESQEWYLPLTKQSLEAGIANTLRSARAPYGGSGYTPNQLLNIQGQQVLNSLSPYMMQYRSYQDLMADLPRIAPYLPSSVTLQDLQKMAENLRPVYFGADEYGMETPVTPRDFVPNANRAYGGSPLFAGLAQLGLYGDAGAGAVSDEDIAKYLK